MEASRRKAVSLILGIVPGALLAQVPGQRPTPTAPGIPQAPDPLNPMGKSDDNRMVGRAEEKQVIVFNTERQRRLVADTDKLLALATELKLDVEKTDKNILSVDVVKKADEIERLAKSVKDRMKG